MSKPAAFIALNRFGLGPRPGDLADVALDPRGWLAAQPSNAAVPAALRGLAPGDEMFRFHLREIERIRTARSASEDPGEDGRKLLLANELHARIRAQIESTVPFRERLVAFWSNHFTVSTSRDVIRIYAGALEREAIRPHVNGRFVEMLQAVVRHPAMLSYLDNTRSVGPNSVIGRKQGRGLNQNLSREVLELHTLGIGGGYTQDDVRQFAAMLTGWTVDSRTPENAGRFRFEPRMHEPGSKTVLGRQYPESGMDEAVSALTAIAAHPATARHVATKLVRHFVADQPPAAAVDRIAGVFQATDGDPATLSQAVIEVPGAWQDPLAKLKSPNDFLVSLVRAAGMPKYGGELRRTLRILGQLPFAAPSPEGWPDTAADWLGSEALMRRVTVAHRVGKRLARQIEPDALFTETIAPVASPRTAEIIRNAPSAAAAIGLVFASVEFQRR